jgi:hypothetical protein
MVTLFVSRMQCRHPACCPEDPGSTAVPACHNTL